MPLLLSSISSAFRPSSITSDCQPELRGECCGFSLWRSPGKSAETCSSDLLHPPTTGKWGRKNLLPSSPGQDGKEKVYLLSTAL